MSNKLPKIINANRVNGEIIVELYGEKFDVTALVKDGVAYATFFGERYQINAPDEPKPKQKRARKSKSRKLGKVVADVVVDKNTGETHLENLREDEPESV